MKTQAEPVEGVPSDIEPDNSVDVTVGDITCPDQSHCPGDSTCCSQGNGTYGCCPLPQVGVRGSGGGGGVEVGILYNENNEAFCMFNL